MIDRDAIHDAVDLLREGGLVAFPTETGTVLGACAERAGSVARLRARGDEVSLWLGPRAPFAEWVHWSAVARHVAATCWPGPLVMRLEPSDRAPSELAVDGGITVAVPSHPIAVALLDAYIDGLVGTPVVPGLPLGASRRLDASGYPTSMTATVLDLCGASPRLQVEGAVPRAVIAALLDRAPPRLAASTAPS